MLSFLSITGRSIIIILRQSTRYFNDRLITIDEVLTFSVKFLYVVVYILIDSQVNEDAKWKNFGEAL